ncbi:DUF3274 domain-containing protein [Massilia sp. YIM B04103]|uniref:T6SS effector phospholipase Tle3 domain-containing protein n=1 Tax=Massilia sp. YIM B04103 TaxID=2963106 RepID=UPI00210A8ED9|nr:DUF3274 domain-containing protein [Massilia sp. YIM B04103]
MGIYPKLPYAAGSATGVYATKRLNDKIIAVRHNTPGNIILVHGVNDVGTGYAAVESGLCEGLSTRLDGDLKPAEYRLPTARDKTTALDDPDAVFYKRKITSETLSPIIPFYWGYRENEQFARKGEDTWHGQCLDRHGNRLDKDFSLGGGPFANATTSLPDMWNRGKWGVYGALDRAQQDATHPVLNNPGRMYMVLAAQRLAALICMIRDYDENETVSIVAHSQGCLIALLAQAFLMDPRFKEKQTNARCADTLILNNPPYSLIDDIPMIVRMIDGYADTDPMMQGRYGHIHGIQTRHVRLTTLANIVRGVWTNRWAAPALSDLTDHARYYGAVGPKWNAAEDRDNRGKVYLYFCPEDMTVALANVQGIGWQGIPDKQRGAKDRHDCKTNYLCKELGDWQADALSELGAGFRQRVFTLKKRPHVRNGQHVLVGASSTEYFHLRADGEDDQAHTEVSDSVMSRHLVRGRLQRSADAPLGLTRDELRTYGARLINGEVLKKPVMASLLEASYFDAKGRAGGMEDVDQITACTAITSAYGMQEIWQCIEFTARVDKMNYQDIEYSPRNKVYEGAVLRRNDLANQVQEHLNSGKLNHERCKVLLAYLCVNRGFTPTPVTPMRVLIKRTETPDEARLRWQSTRTGRSFHSAIFNSKQNHRNVTAYDVAIGGGQASSDPNFYTYLCQVADWRLQIDETHRRHGVVFIDRFREQFKDYLESELKWRKRLILDSASYYSTGMLPVDLPVFPDGCPLSVLSKLD